MAYLQLTDLRKSYGPAVAVDQFNLDAREGEFVSFLGPSGCGKTTTMRMIAGFEQPDHGKVMIAGEDITNMPANRRRDWILSSPWPSARKISASRKALSPCEK